MLWPQPDVGVHVKVARVERGHQRELAEGSLPRWVVWDDAQQKCSRLFLCLKGLWIESLGQGLVSS